MDKKRMTKRIAVFLYGGVCCLIFSGAFIYAVQARMPASQSARGSDAGLICQTCDPPPPPQPQAVLVKIDWTDTHQVIDGFGVALPGWDPNNAQDPATVLFNTPERSQIMDTAFSQANGGIGLTILRTKVPPLLETSPGVFDDRDEAQTWIMQEAVKRGPVKLIASVWSPPPWMKTNGSIVGGKLKEERYPEFADLLAHYASQYARKNGVDIYAVSMSNEPDTVAPWDTCAWTDAQIARFLSSHLSPTFAIQQIATKVIAPETSRWDSIDSFLRSTYNNPTAFERVDLVAGHLYCDCNPSRSVPTALKAGKRIWQTEIMGNAWSIDDALNWATKIHDGLTGAQISAWLWWAMYNGLPGRNEAGAGNLIGYNPTAVNRIAVSPTFWALGNFSKFVRPGFVRIGTYVQIGVGESDPGLRASSYKDPNTGQLVVVAINTGVSALDISFSAPGFAGGALTPYITSISDNLAQQPPVSLSSRTTIPGRSVVTYVSRPPNLVSYRRPDGMILSTGNLYFTTHDELGAHVYRTGQTSSPDQEIELYHEPPGNRFGDIVFANVGGAFYGYFWSMNTVGQSFIKRIPLTGSPVSTVLTPAFTNVDIANSHHNLATDGVNLYWQDVSSVKRMPIGGGAIATLDVSAPNTPTAGVYLNNGNIIYASVAALRYVPTNGAMTSPESRTIANANAPVTTILPVANGVYWGDRLGAIQLRSTASPAVITVQANTGLVPTSLETNGYTAGGALIWTQCASSTCRVRLEFPVFNAEFPVANHALGASMNSVGNYFWGDDYGVHRWF
jgi:glucuronoarabinoxylan endo-1,4-beta-xylanase